MVDVCRFAKEAAGRGVGEAWAVAGEEEMAEERDGAGVLAEEEDGAGIDFLFSVGVEGKISREGISIDERVQVEGLLEILRRQDVFRFAVGQDVMIGQNHEAAAPFRGHREVVANHEDGLSGGGEIPAQAENFFLVEEVERGGRFVQEENRRLLGEDFGEHDALLFATGKGADGFGGKGGRPGVGHPFFGDGFVVFVFFFPPFEVGVARREHDFLGGVGEGKLEILLHEGDALGDFFIGEGLRVDTAQGNAAAGRCEEPADGFEECAFSRAVRPQETDEFARLGGERAAIQHGFRFHGEGNVFDFQEGAHHASPPSLRMRRMR